MGEHETTLFVGARNKAERESMAMHVPWNPGLNHGLVSSSKVIVNLGITQKQKLKIMTKDLQASNCTMLDFMCLLLQGMHTSAMNLLSLKKKDIILEIYLEISHWQLKNQLLILILSRKRNIKIKADPIVIAHILSASYWD